MGVGSMLIINLSRGAWGLWQAQDRMKEADRRLEELTKKKQALEAQLNYQMTESYAEQEIRNKLGMAKPGELVAILPEGDKNQVPSTEYQVNNVPDYSSAANEPNWKKWLNVFGF